MLMWKQIHPQLVCVLWPSTNVYHNHNNVQVILDMNMKYWRIYNEDLLNAMKWATIHDW
jgi:hypothetical protein